MTTEERKAAFARIREILLLTSEANPPVAPSKEQANELHALESRLEKDWVSKGGAVQP